MKRFSLKKLFCSISLSVSLKYETESISGDDGEYHSDRFKGEDRIDKDSASADNDFASDNENNLSGLCHRVSAHTWCINLLLLDIMPITLAKPFIISLLVYVSTLFWTRPLT